MNKKILFIADSWKNKKSGLGTLLYEYERNLTSAGWDVMFLTPLDLFNFNAPFINQRWGLIIPWKFYRLLNEYKPDAIHIISEEFVGGQAALLLKIKGIKFTTAYHTDAQALLYYWFGKYSIYLAKFIRCIFLKYLKFFHSLSAGIFIPVESSLSFIKSCNITNIVPWFYGIDKEMFNEKKKANVYKGNERPITLYVGRIEPDKNVDFFLSLPLPGTKVVIGEGSEFHLLKKKYEGNKEILFLGGISYSLLPPYYASADVFLFPSFIEAFGFVQLEALASGIPVVSFNVNGPKDIVKDGDNGYLVEYSDNIEKNKENFIKAWHKALELKKKKGITLEFPSVEKSMDYFIDQIKKINNI